MKIRQLQIHSFGKLKDREIILEDGINIVYGSNESGKSTMHAFIRAMLYGIQRQRGRAARNDTYSRYEPWENSSFFSGRMRFESGGKIFRLSRNFYKNDIKEELICETDGECLSIAQGDLEVLLGNVSESVFDNTISVEQLRSRTGDELDVQLRNFMANYEASSDGELDIEKAKAILKAQRKEYEQKQKVEFEKQEVQKKQFTIKIEYVQEELQGIEEQLKQRRSEWIQYKRLEDKEHSGDRTKNDHQCTEQQGEIQREQPRKIQREQLREVKKGQLKQKRLRIIAAAGTFCLGLTVISLFSKFPGWITAVGMFCGVGMLSVSLLLRTGKQQIDNGDEFAEQEESQRQKEYRKHLLWKIEQLKEAQKEKAMQFENLQADHEEYCSMIREDDKNQEEIDSITMALDSIDEISSNMQKYWEKDLHRRISAIIQEITSGRYIGVEVADNRRVALHTKDHYVPLEQASHGTIEQLYFSLRMAAADYLCQEESMPVLLDEVFAMYDEERMEAALKWLAEHKEQVVIFTCQKRELAIAKRLGLSVNKSLL